MAEFPTKRIINLGEQSAPQSGDYIVTDNQTTGTKKTPASALATSQALAAEVTARQQADTTLDGKITAEAQARANAIEAEQTAREEADDALTESVTALSDEVTAQGALIQNPTKTVSESIAHFTDGADMPAKSVIVNIEPQQSGSGTPSPDNVRPISGWESVVTSATGVNVWDEEWENGYINSAGQPASDPTAIRSKNFVRVVPNTTYYGKSLVPMGIRFYDENQTFIGTASVNNATFMTPSNAQCLKFYCANTATYNNDISINYPSTDTDYHAYNPNSSTATTDLGRTVYGGTLDVVSGVLTVDRVMVTVSNLTKAGSLQTGTYTCCQRYDLSPVANTVSISQKHGAISNMGVEDNAYYGSARPNESGSSNVDYAIGTVGTILTVYDADLTLTDTAFADKYGSMQIAYPLAEPQTYTLTPTEVKTLLGENNVWADAGAVEVTYRRDINLALEQIEALLNGTETASQTASTAETSEA